MKSTVHSITDIEGIKVGHAQDFDALTGCTVVLCENGAVAGVDQRGGAPGTRETDLLRTSHLVNNIHAILLTGGSAFGLDAASGVMKYLSEKNVGFNSGITRVPIVPAAVIFDLAIGKSEIRPDLEMGYQACQNARDYAPLEGNYGAGTGASIGKIFGPSSAMKSGVGTSAIDVGGGVLVGALCVVNALGDIIDYRTGKMVAGARSTKKGPFTLGSDSYFANTMNVFRKFYGRKILQFMHGSNTVIGVVATNAILSKEENSKVAQMAQNGLAMTIRPANTMFDGDTLFSVSTQKKKADVNVIGSFASLAVAEAILRGVIMAKSAGGLPSFADIPQFDKT